MDVFISYSRKDKNFVQKLHEGLTQSQKDSWVDWEDIPLTADWWAEIQAGIEESDTFVFVISPDSVDSKVCHQEIDHAVQHNKRLIPIVYRYSDGVPDALSHLNWIFFRETDDFDAAFEKLLEAMETDLDWVKKHTRLTRRAVEWDREGRNESYLLRGDDLADAEEHLSQANRKPALTQLQQEYIVSSQQKQAADLIHELEQAKALAETEKRRVEEQKRYNAQLRRRSMVVIGALVLAIVLGVVAFILARQTGAVLHSTEEVIGTVIEFSDAETNSDVCWAGSLNGMSGLVMPACEVAVKLEPDVSYNHEGRGLAHALMGDFTTAQADFETAIEKAKEFGDGEDRIPMWQEWVQHLEEGRNPFDEKVLQQLRDEWEANKEIHRSEQHDN